MQKTSVLSYKDDPRSSFRPKPAGCRMRQSCYALLMADQRALDAINRIERALARIETAGAVAQDAAPEGATELEQVRGAHQALRMRVEGAIGQIDRLLDAGARG
jgi:hypothetical protein